MTFDLFMVWSNLCPIFCGNTGRLFHDICKFKYAGERIVAYGPLVFLFVLLSFLLLLFIFFCGSDKYMGHLVTL